LGTYARSVRKDKKTTAAKTFDNDNLPMTDKLSVVGNTTQASTDAPDEAQVGNQLPSLTGKPMATPDEKKPPTVQPGQSAEDRQKVYDDWQQKLTAQKAQVDSLAHQMDVMQGEYRLRAAAMYGDAGNRLRNSAEWDKEDADFKQKSADQQKALEDAKQHLEDMQEDARKSGVPSSVTQ